MLSKLEERNNEIIQELKDQGYANRKINYEEFLRIYEPYKEEMSEKDFSLLLGISEGNFINLKYRRKNVIILKDKKIEDKLISEIRDELIRKGYANKKINYEEFLQLYDPYKGKISESKFALALGLSYVRFSNDLKYKRRNVIILIDREEQEQKFLTEQIKKELKAKGYANKKIDYEGFLKIYEPYKEKMSEKKFAGILGISNSFFRQLRSGRSNAIILKDEKEQERLEEEIKKELISKRYMNKNITYEEFLKIYEKYKKIISEKNFAKILGITELNFRDFKYKRRKTTKINFNYKRDKRIKYLFRKSKKYKKSYFEKISQKFNIPIDNVLEIVGKKDYLEALESKGYIFLGKKRLSQDFIDRNIDGVSKKLHGYSKFIGRKLHTSSYAEDIAQETLLKIIEERGDLEENYLPEKAIEKLKAYACSIIKYKHFRLLKLRRVISLDENLSDGDKRTRYYRVKAKENVEEAAEKREEQIEIAKGDTAVITIQKCLENGMDRDNALKFVMEKYKLTKEELLEILKEELLKRKELKTAEDGRVYLAEKSNKEADGELDY